MCRKLCRLLQLLSNAIQTHFFDADTDTYGQNRCSAYNLSLWDWLAKNEHVAQHRINNVHKWDERDKAAIATLKRHCLSEHTNSVQKACSCEQCEIGSRQFEEVKWSAVQQIPYEENQDSRCHAKEAMIEEHDGVGDLAQRSI